MMCFYMNTTEVVSPLFGAAVSTADKLQGVPLYAIKVASPVLFGAATLVAERYNSDTIYATKVAAPDGVENKRNLCLFYATEVASPE
jgi:hypothetical protein